jgi:hypothetical protein
MHEYSFCDSSLEKNKSDSYHLSILASRDGFSFTILDPYRSMYLAYCHVPFTMPADNRDLPDLFERQLKNEELMGLEYDTVYCIICSNKSTLLPAGLFQKEKIRSYFEFNHNLGDLDELHANYLKHLDAYLVFSVYHEIANVFVRYFPKAEIFNQATPFIEDALLRKDVNNELVSAAFHSGYFDIIYIRGKQLILHNNVTYRNPSDLIYFILYVYDKLGLDTSKVPLELSGNIDPGDEAPEMIRKFIRNISYGKASKQYGYAQGFKKMHEHTYLNLCNLYHCV